MISSKNLIQILVFFGGILISLTAIFLTGAEKVSFGDAEDYILAANALLRDIGDYPASGICLPFFRPPFYPFFITSIWLVFPKSILAVKIAQGMIFGANCWIIYRIGFALSQNATAAALGALVFLLNPFFVLHVTDIQTETLHTFLFSSAMLILVKILTTKAVFHKIVWKASAVGALWGLAALCRPSALPVALVLTGCLFFLKFRELKFFRSFALGATIAGGVFLTILPWALVNYQRTGEFIWINDASGYALWVGNHPKSIALYEHDFLDLEAYDRYCNYLLDDLAREKIAEWNRTENYAALSLKQREKLWQREALANMRANPALTARLWFYKTWAFWKPYLNPMAYSAAAVIFSGIFLIALFLAAFYGAKIVWTDYNNKQVMILFGVLFLSATAVHVFIVSMIRYRVPYVDVYFCVLAGIFAHNLGDAIRSVLQNRKLKLS